MKKRPGPGPGRFLLPRWAGPPACSARTDRKRTAIVGMKFSGTCNEPLQVRLAKGCSEDTPSARSEVAVAGVRCQKTSAASAH